MTTPRNFVSAREFRQRVKAKLMQTKNIKEEDLYFATMLDTYYVDYKPAYPKKSNRSFTVCMNWINGSIAVYGNPDAPVPTISHYKDLEDFESRF